MVALVHRSAASTGSNRAPTLSWRYLRPRTKFYAASARDRTSRTPTHRSTKCCARSSTAGPTLLLVERVTRPAKDLHHRVAVRPWHTIMQMRGASCTSRKRTGPTPGDRPGFAATCRPAGSCTASAQPPHSKPTDALLHTGIVEVLPREDGRGRVLRVRIGQGCGVGVPATEAEVQAADAGDALVDDDELLVVGPEDGDPEQDEQKVPSGR
jgi:hypothetical protein